MLDPIRVSILTSGMGDNGQLCEKGVPAELFAAYVSRFVIFSTRATDFQVMLLFSMGFTKGKWATLYNMLLSFKTFYDENAQLTRALPDLVNAHPERYGHLGLKDLGDKMFAFLRKKDPGTALNHAYSKIPLPKRAVERHSNDRLKATRSWFRQPS
jgi:arginine decarboxylase